MENEKRIINEGNRFRGPDDDGKTVDGPATLAQAAFENGIKYVNTLLTYMPSSIHL